MTLLDAKTHRSFPDAGSPLSPVFAQTACYEETVKLGRAFANAARGMRLLSRTHQRPYRIGLCGLFNAGKTSFAWGMKAELRGYDVIEQNCKSRQQYVWQHRDPAKGVIRYYDSRVIGIDEKLPSYVRGDVSKYGLPLLDIVENPMDDRHNTAFDCMIFAERATLTAKHAPRNFAFTATEEIRNLPAYKMFLERARIFSAGVIEPTAPRGANPI